MASLDKLGIGPRARRELLKLVDSEPRDLVAAQAHRELMDRYAPKVLAQ